jgi:pyruvate kinase
MEAHVMASLDAVLDVLHLLRNRSVSKSVKRASSITFSSGDALLADHANAILGSISDGGKTRIMVTMPSEAAVEPAFIRNLLIDGMNIMRINCAHDDAEAWARMIVILRQAEKELGRSCKVCFDLAGPKLRTGAMEAEEGVAKLRPRKNRLGQLIAPAIVRLVGEVPGMALKDGDVPVQGDLLARARTGDRVELTDARGRDRTLEVIENASTGCVCRASRTAYLVAGTGLTLCRKKSVIARAAIGTLPPEPQAILLRPGDVLDLVKGDVLGRDALLDEGGCVIEPAVVGCQLDEVFRGVRRGERIFFDDGKIAGRIRNITDDRVRIDIVSVAGGAAKLHGEKGINLPDSALQLPALTAKDLADLAFVVRHADMVAMSFVQQTQDIEDLIGALQSLGASALGIVLKIETQQAFSRLPNLLLAAMRHHAVAVMVARGDLGVEVGFERLSEVQEEILWLCEAAHVPVIWATQVLESLSKGGIPSRAEVTDAAMGSRAECVMLNKGPYIMQTMRFLRDVLNRMETHHNKKTAMLRKLSISGLHEAQPRALFSAKPVPGVKKRRGDNRKVA